MGGISRHRLGDRLLANHLDCARLRILGLLLVDEAGLTTAWNSNRNMTTPASRLPPPGRSCKRTAMTTRARTVASSRTGFAGETARALASTLLLLGLIGDRRVR